MTINIASGSSNIYQINYNFEQLAALFNCDSLDKISVIGNTTISILPNEPSTGFLKKLINCCFPYHKPSPNKKLDDLEPVIIKMIFSIQKIINDPHSSIENEQGLQQLPLKLSNAIMGLNALKNLYLGNIQAIKKIEKYIIAFNNLNQYREVDNILLTLTESRLSSNSFQSASSSMFDGLRVYS